MLPSVAVPQTPRFVLDPILALARRRPPVPGTQVTLLRLLPHQHLGLWVGKVSCTTTLPIPGHRHSQLLLLLLLKVRQERFPPRELG